MRQLRSSHLEGIKKLWSSQGGKGGRGGGGGTKRRHDGGAGADCADRRRARTAAGRGAPEQPAVIVLVEVPPPVCPVGVLLHRFTSGDLCVTVGDSLDVSRVGFTPLGDEALADLLLLCLPQDPCPLLYADGTWLFFDGTHWQPDDGKLEVDRLVSKLLPAVCSTLATYVLQQHHLCPSSIPRAKKRARRDPIKREALRKWEECQRAVKRLGSNGGIRAVVERAAVVFAEPLALRTFDTDPDVLGVANGVVDLRTGRLLPPSARHRVLCRAPTSYDADARCPNFQRFLLDVFDEDAATVEYVQVLLGYGLTGHQSMQCMAVLFSKHGRSGKSVLTAVLAAVLGDVLTAQLAANTVTQPAHQASPQAHTAHLEPLRTARLAFAPETLRGARLDAGFVKAVTGEDSISSRAPFGSSTRAFRVAALLLLATNELPVLPPNDPALRDRLRVVPFPCYFVGDSGGSVPLGGVVVRPRKADVKADLCAEAAGVLAWLVEGAVAWYDNGKRLPPETDAMREATAAYREQHKGEMEAFLEQACEPDTAARTTARALFDAYTAWRCGVPREQQQAWPAAASPQALGHRLSSHGVQRMNGRHRDSDGVRDTVYVGLKVKVRPPCML